MELRGLRTSWATPAAIFPRATNFSWRCIFFSRFFSSVRSWNGIQSGKSLGEEDIKAREKFFEETADERKQIAVKRAELRALMTQENADTTKAGALAGELFELRADFHKKAKESGVKLGPRELGDHPGALGKGYGRPHGRHGKGWNRACQ